MGLIRAALGSAGSVMADQWKEYFYCDAMPVDVLAVKGRKRTNGRSVGGENNIISNGSVIAVNENQCMLIVEQGKIVEMCAEPGAFTYDSSSEPSFFTGGLNKKNIMEVLGTIGRRITFGGVTAKDQRVYFINMRELTGNKYGTPSPVPFRVVDNRVGLDFDISIRCFGEYSYRITNPVLFYRNVCGNISSAYNRAELDSQLRTELLSALQEAFAKISDMGIRYSALPGHTRELANSLNEVLSADWRDKRGIEIVSVGVSSVKASEEDEARIKDMQTLSNPTLAAAHMVGAQAQAMKDAAKNAAGAAMGFMGMNMAGAAGGFNAQQLYQMGMQQAAAAPAPAAPAADSWDCPSCGQKGVTGKFCPECGTKKPLPKVTANGAWTCPSCGASNTGKFCMECGTKKPDDGKWVCACGAVNTGKFCMECGAKRS